MKGRKAGVRNSKTVERCNGRAAGNEVTGQRADGKRADNLGRAGQDKEFDFTPYEVGSHCGILNRGVP